MKKKADATSNQLVPKHAKVSDKEKEDLLKKYQISLRELPKISVKDPAIRELKLKEGDVVKIVRDSQTSGTTVYYRGVVNA